MHYWYMNWPSLVLVLGLVLATGSQDASTASFVLDCPYGCGCTSQQNGDRVVVCRNIRADIADVLANVAPETTILSLKNCAMPTLNASWFRHLKNLREFTLRQSSLRNIYIDWPRSTSLGGNSSLLGNGLVPLLGLRTVRVNQCPLDTLNAADLLRWVPNVETLNVSDNQIEDVVTFIGFKRLLRVDLSHNHLSAIPAFPPYVQEIDLSFNQIGYLGTSLSNLSRLQGLNLSNNRFGQLDPVSFEGMAGLKSLDLSSNNFRGVLEPIKTFTYLENINHINLSGNPLSKIGEPFPSSLLNLENLDLSNLHFETIDIGLFSALKNLRELDLSYNRNLIRLQGGVFALSDSLKRIDLTGCNLKALPYKFLPISNRAHQSVSLGLSGNQWACDCRLSWLYRHLITPATSKNNYSSASGPWLPRTVRIVDWNKLFCSYPEARNRSLVLRSGLEIQRNESHFGCDVGIAVDVGDPSYPEANKGIVRSPYGTRVVLPCEAFASGGDAIVEWTKLGLPDNSPLFRWVPESETVLDLRVEGSNGSSNLDSLSMLPGGALVIEYPTKRNLGLYRCTAFSPTDGTNATMVVSFRLNYGHWWLMKIYSLIAGVLLTMLFFALKMILMCIRRIVLWRFRNMERSSRIKALLESIEKYKVRQMECLYEKYQNSVMNVRDNYQGQMDNLKQTYESNAEKLRDYRVDKVESFSAHIDTAKDNYNQQVVRISEYGSRQMERLWESYEAQMNRIRGFSLQQRLRLMRTYKIKQRYIDKILHKINFESAAAASGKTGDRRFWDGYGSARQPPEPEVLFTSPEDMMLPSQSMPSASHLHEGPSSLSRGGPAPLIDDQSGLRAARPLRGQRLPLPKEFRNSTSSQNGRLLNEISSLDAFSNKSVSPRFRGTSVTENDMVITEEPQQFSGGPGAQGKGGYGGFRTRFDGGPCFVDMMETVPYAGRGDNLADIDDQELFELDSIVSDVYHSLPDLTIDGNEEFDRIVAETEAAWSPKNTANNSPEEMGGGDTVEGGRSSPLDIEVIICPEKEDYTCKIPLLVNHDTNVQKSDSPVVMSSANKKSSPAASL